MAEPVEEIKFDFEKTQITLEDLDIPVQVTEEVKEPVKELELPNEEIEVEPIENETFKEVLTKDVSLDEIETPGEEEVTTTDDPRIEAARALLQKKMERYGISSDTDVSSLTEEDIVEFEEKLDNAILESKYESVKSVNKNIKTILDYIENEGDPTKIAELFKRQEAIEKIDTSSEEGKLRFLADFYKEVQGWSEDKISRRLDKLKINDQVESEFEDLEEDYKKFYDKKIEEETSTQKAKQQEKEAKEMELQTLVLDKLKVNKNIDNKVKNDIFTTAFGKGTLNGTVIPILDYKISELKQDPEKYLELAHFISDMEGYKKSILQNKKNEIVTKGLEKGSLFEKRVTPDNTAVKSKNIERPKFKFNT